jgi:hypothetical protein
MNRILKTEPVNSVKSIRDLLTIVNEAEDSAWKVHGVSPFDDQTRSIQATKERMKKGKLASTSAGDAPELANNLINSPKSPDMFPTPEKRLFHPADTSYAQDHPSSFIPPEDNENSLSDLDKAPSYSAPQYGTAPKPHPAGKPKTSGAKFDPAVQKLQYELRAKGYPIKADGILGPDTQKVIDWENMSQDRDARVTGYDDLRANMDQSIEPVEPFDNTQGDFDHTDPSLEIPEIPEIPKDPNARIAESVTFSQEDSLARIMQIAQWR